MGNAVTLETSRNYCATERGNEMNVIGIDLDKDETCLGAAEVMTTTLLGMPNGKMVNDVILFTDKRVLVCSRASFGKLVAASAVGSVAQTVGLGHSAALAVAGGAFGAMKSTGSVKIKVHKIKHAFELKDVTKLTEDEGRMRKFSFHLTNGEPFHFWIGKTIAWSKPYITILQENGVEILPSQRTDSRLRHALEAATGDQEA
jgi:hypothetical protein